MANANLSDLGLFKTNELPRSRYRDELAGSRSRSVPSLQRYRQQRSWTSTTTTTTSTSHFDNSSTFNRQESSASSSRTGPFKTSSIDGTTSTTLRAATLPPTTTTTLNQSLIATNPRIRRSTSRGRINGIQTAQVSNYFLQLSFKSGFKLISNVLIVLSFVSTPRISNKVLYNPWMTRVELIFIKRLQQ